MFVLCHYNKQIQYNIVRSISRICKGKDIAVILTEKKGGGGHFFKFKSRLFYFLFRNAISWLPLNKSDNSKYIFFVTIYN